MDVDFHSKGLGYLHQLHTVSFKHLEAGIKAIQQVAINAGA
jgi:hypothetical protein